MKTKYDLYNNPFKEDISFMRDTLSREQFADKIIEAIKDVGQENDFLEYVKQDLWDEGESDVFCLISSIDDVKPIYMKHWYNDNIWGETIYEDIATGYVDLSEKVAISLGHIAHDFAKEEEANYFAEERYS